MGVGRCLPGTRQIEYLVEPLVSPNVAKLLRILRDASRKDERAMNLLPRAKALNKPIWNPREQGSLSLVHAQEDVVPPESLPDVECCYVGYAQAGVDGKKNEVLCVFATPSSSVITQKRP